MVEGVVRVAQGGLAAGLTLILICTIKKSDAVHRLPERCGPISKLCFFAGGFLLPPTGAITGLLVLFAAYLAAMAYTDYYARQVYPFYCILVATFGYGWLCCSWVQRVGRVDMIWTIGYILLVLIGQRLRAYTLGDAEIFVAAIPALAAVASHTGRDLCQVYTFFFLGSAVCGVIGWLIRLVMTGSRDNNIAYVPAMYGAFLALLFLCG